jgi:hypothetical protein
MSSALARRGAFKNKKVTYIYSIAKAEVPSERLVDIFAEIQRRRKVQ